MIELITNEPEGAIIVGVATRNISKLQVQEHLNELALLADTAGAKVLHRIMQERDGFDPAFYIGKGKVDEIKNIALGDNINLVIFDDELSPVQLRNLEREIEKKIVDRSGLILDIFAKRAKSNEAKTQVELAQMQYLLPRLTRMWTHLSKQFGGIRTKGPGETQIESDRRMIRVRISALKKKLDKISQQRITQRSGRKDFFTIALVGYTNVGKSTLLNSLANSTVFVENRLFATLDTTTRTVALNQSQNILISDTVGFIRKLPHNLVASFKSTLEEVVEADLLLHVVDATHPLLEEQIEVVKETLEEIGAIGKNIFYVFNKIDQMTDRTILKALQERFTPSIAISAQRGINILGLKEKISEVINASYTEINFSLPMSDYKLISQIRNIAMIVKSDYDEEKVNLKLRVSKNNLSHINNLISKYKNEPQIN